MWHSVPSFARKPFLVMGLAIVAITRQRRRQAQADKSPYNQNRLV
jgi:hypothetical protein